MSDFYLLDKNKQPYKVEMLKWAEWLESDYREKHVRHTYINLYDVRISTVFLGMDHGYPQWSHHPKNYKPVLFETMIFWNHKHELDQYQERYHTWDEALAGHRRAVREVIKYIRENINERE
jgi:hypothetical protein